MSLTFYVLLWAHPGPRTRWSPTKIQSSALSPTTAARSCNARGATAPKVAHWKFSYSSSSAEAFDAYMADSRRTALASERDRAIARTELINVQLV